MPSKMWKLLATLDCSLELPACAKIAPALPILSFGDCALKAHPADRIPLCKGSSGERNVTMMCTLVPPAANQVACKLHHLAWSVLSRERRRCLHLAPHYGFDSFQIEPLRTSG